MVERKYIYDSNTGDIIRMATDEEYKKYQEMIGLNDGVEG